MNEKSLSGDARNVLASATITGTTLYLPPTQLPRPLYLEINEALTRLGGKWHGGKVKGHLFDHDPREDLKIMVQTGFLPPKNPLAFFPTPKEIVTRMLQDAVFGLCQIDLADIATPRLLEPSAGRGAIAFAMREYAQACHSQSVVECCEIDEVFATFLRSEGLPVVFDNFLDYHPTDSGRYHAILMNPPFRLPGDPQAYITHISHAWEMLVPSGLLVAIAPSGFTFHKDRQAQQFLALVEEYGLWEALPAGTFAESGTAVNTVLLCMRKPSSGSESSCIISQTDVQPRKTHERERQHAPASVARLDQLSLW